MVTKALARDGSRRGGARPGSGRKPKPTTLAVNDFNRITRDQVGDWLPGLLANLKVLADGVKLRDVDADGKVVEYYTVPPDRQANEYLINRLLGKPREIQEVSGPEGQAIPVAIMAAIDRVYGLGRQPAG